jgi:hypothetical protein
MCQLLRQFVVSSNKVASDARLIAWSMPRDAYRQFDLEWLIGNFSMEHMAHLPDTGLSLRRHERAGVLSRLPPTPYVVHGSY